MQSLNSSMPCHEPPNSSIEKALSGLRPQAPLMSNVKRHRASTSRIGLVQVGPDGERLVAYLERRTPWDS